jgi:hypothetical protein
MVANLLLRWNSFVIFWCSCLISVPLMRAFPRRLAASRNAIYDTIPRYHKKPGIRFLPINPGSRCRFSTFPAFTNDGTCVVPSSVSPVCLQAGKTPKSEGDETYDQTFRDLEEEIAKLNKGIPINVNSPKQVSTAIFGKVQSTSRTILQAAAQGQLLDESGQPLNEKQQRLAALVLECRDYRYRSTEDSKPKDDDDVAASAKGGEIKESNALLKSSLEDFNNGGTAATTNERTIVEKNDILKPQPFNANDTSQYDKLVDSIFDNKHNLIHQYWRDVLKQVTRASARALVTQLDPTTCPMGYNPQAVPRDPLRGSAAATSNTSNDASTTTTGKKGSFLHFCREMKKKHPDCVVVTRCGDFYETFGVDAIMLVEHCGLNAMASKAKAGFPFRSIQASLDCLTDKGFKVAVYEEAVDTDASSGAGAKAGAKSRLKTRMLAQVISPASPTYMYDLVLLGNTADTLATAVPARPYMGVISLANGYTLVEVSVEERSVRISERLTAEAVACRLAAYPPASPLLMVPSPTEYQSHSGDTARIAPFLPSVTNSHHGSRLSIKVIPPSLVEEPRAGVSDLERARRTIVSALLQMTDFDEGDMEGMTSQRRAGIDDFTLIASSHDTIEVSKTQTRPLHVETATQLGLMNDKAIPDLMEYILPNSAPAAIRRFLRRYLLTPPPPEVCEAMSNLVTFLKDDKNSPSVPPLVVPPLGKVLALLRAGQASAPVYGELLQAMAATVMVLDIQSNGECSTKLVEPLMTILEHESGMAAEPQSLKKRCMDAMTLIENVVSPLHHAGAALDHYDTGDPISDSGNLIPSGFIERNEAMWRGRVQPIVAAEAYARVKTAADALAQAVAADFFGTTKERFEEEERKGDAKNKNVIVQDVFNNLFAIREIPAWVSKAERDKYVHPRDRNGKILKNRYTTEDVRSALSEYVAACEDACQSVSAALTKLSQDLYDQGHLPAVVQAAHSNLILSTAFHHSRRANALGWDIAEVCDDEGSGAGYFHDVWPYWLDKSVAVPNTFEMKDLFLLTAPNMSGKSTLMRATAAAALLSVGGLCAPLKSGSKVRRFDELHVRSASADVPAEHKSAFGAEMSDIASLLRCCGPRSLVFVDELGRGTSPRDGTRLAGAVLESMAKAGMSGFFATHLHDILQLPLECSDRINKKRMKIHDEDSGDIKVDDGSSPLSRRDYRWTYRLADGVCTDSMALVTAERFGLPSSVLARAEELSAFVPNPDPKPVVFPETGTPINGQGRNGMAENRESHGFMHDDVLHLVKDASGQVPVSIPARWSPPASLEGQSCVYILKLDREGHPYYYVGETDSLEQRLRQHRAKGGAWECAGAIAFAVPGGKSQTRSMESIIIQELAKSGFSLQSTFDGRSLRSSRRNNL